MDFLRVVLVAALVVSGCDESVGPVNHTVDAEGPLLDLGVAVDVTVGDSAAPDGLAPDAVVEPEADAAAPIPLQANIATAADGWYRGDFHYHTTYSADAERQGGDDLATALAIADAFRDPVFLAANPHLAGNGLDFIAITDHRTDAPLSDPAFHHDHLIVIPGEEYGGSGHANILGLQAHIPHDPVDGESLSQRHTDAIAEAHAQGAIFSTNHPGSDNPWVWDVEGYDSVEAWNGPWSAMAVGVTLEEMEARLGGGETENPYIRDAIVGVDGLGNDQSLRFWQNHLTAGVHIPLIGGGDRHMLLPAGIPTTYVRRPSSPAFADLEGPALGYAGIIEGVREGGTFVSRSTFGAQIDLHAEAADGTRFPLGAELPDHGPWTIHARIARAAGGEVRFIGGKLKPLVDGRVASAPRVVHRVDLPSDDVSLSFEWTPPVEGGWLHALVLEPLIVEPLPLHAENALVALSMPTSDNVLASMVMALVPFLDLSVAFDAQYCDPADWMPWQGHCMPADQSTWATFYLPDPIERLLHAWFEDGEITDYCLGAITSAFMVRAVP